MTEPDVTPEPVADPTPPVQEPDVPYNDTPDKVATVVLTVVGPLHTTAFTSPATEDGPGVTVTAAGTEVPADEAEAIVLSAAAYGVSIVADGDYPSNLTETKAS